MKEDNLFEKKNPTIIPYRNPGIAVPVADVLTDVLRRGACELLQHAVEAEVEAFIERHRELKDEKDRQRIVRNGYQPEREIQTGIGDVPVRKPRVRDRAGEIKFTSTILPRYLRRTKSVEELLPWLYLKGLSTGDFQAALTALLGKDAPGLSATTISRLKEVWREQHERWSKRDLTGKQYVYIWVDGVHFGVRLEDASQCILVIIGVRPDGKKELLAMTDGYRESEISWKEVLLDLKQRGLTIDPRLAIGDGALGFWKALPQVFGTTRGQRCWVHKTRMYSTSCRSVSRRKQRKLCTRSGWPKAVSMPKLRSIFSYLPIRRSIRRLPSVSRKIATHCSRSMIFRLSTGCTSGRQTRSNRPSRPSDCEPQKHEAVSPGPHYWQWSSS